MVRQKNDRQTYTVRMNPMIKQQLDKISKKAGQSVADLLEEILINALDEIKVEDIDSSYKKDLKDAVNDLEFQHKIQKFLWEKIIKEGLNGREDIESYILYMKGKEKEANIIFKNEKKKKKVLYWINQQILKLQSGDYENVDLVYEREFIRLLHHMIYKACNGNKSKAHTAMNIINGKLQLKGKTIYEVNED